MIDTCTPDEKEQFIVDSYAEALCRGGIEYVVRFRFMGRKKNRPSHYLIFLTKHEKGYIEMKETIHRECVQNDGFGWFEFNPRLGSCQVGTFALLSDSKEELMYELKNKYSGKKETAFNIFKNNHRGTNFIAKSYYEAMTAMKVRGWIDLEPVNSKGIDISRRKSNRVYSTDIVIFKDDV